jgi:hypothetical protein
MRAAFSCAALLAGLGAAAPAAVSAGRGHGAARAGRAAVPGSQLWVSRYKWPPPAITPPGRWPSARARARCS